MRYQFVVIGFGEANAGILPFKQHIDITLPETRLSPEDEAGLADTLRSFFLGDEVLTKDQYEGRVSDQETMLLPFGGGINEDDGEDDEEVCGREDDSEESTHDANGMA